MDTRRPGEKLVDRRRERGILDELLHAVREGLSRVVVMDGEAGVGKTALLDYTIAAAVGFQIATVAGVESEMELPYAALHQLCASEVDRIERLPTPQRDALGVAFGLRTGEPPDRFLVGLAALSLLSDVAEDGPLLCVIDDAQWLDHASATALAFIARRLFAESVGLVFAMRQPSDDLGGLAQLHLAGLAASDARALLSQVLRVPLDRGVQNRIVAEARGNPLALLELSRAPTAVQLAGGFGLPGAWPLPRDVNDAYHGRLTALPAETQKLLVIAAAEPLGDPLLLGRAAEQLGVPIDAAGAAEAEELLSIGPRVTFRHPVVRSAAYRLASAEDRRAAHAALAEVTDPDLDPDRRAWHRAQATPGPNETVAAELEASAGRAQARGGLAAAAAFLDRATALTLEPERRTQRALDAANAKVQTGSFDAALALMETAETGPVDAYQRAKIDLLRGRIAFAMNAGSDAPPLLLRAAKRFEPIDITMARRTYLDALAAALLAARLSTTVSVHDIADAILAAPALPGPPGAADELLEGLALLIVKGNSVGAPMLLRALETFRVATEPASEQLRWLWLAGHAAGLLWDYEMWDLLSARFVKLARDVGALGTLPVALSTRAGVELFAGRLVVAESLQEECEAVSDTTGSRIAPYTALGLAAMRGHEAKALALIEVGTEDVTRRGEGVGLTFIQWATALLYNGLGRYEEALAAARQATDDSSEQRFCLWALVELIEAATRTGRRKEARHALGRLLENIGAGDTDWGAGIAELMQALPTAGDVAERHYTKAIDRLGRASVGVAHARAHLLYGEWLRRERRRSDAREHLRTAHDLFQSSGMRGFAERARVELAATGETARRRIPETRDDLTPQETQISRLAAEGATNREIGAQLFISPSTVDYHLRKAFRKLGVRSRAQLARRLLAVDSSNDPNATSASSRGADPRAGPQPKR